MSKITDLVSFVRGKFGEGFVPLHEPRFIGNEKQYVNDAIDSTFVSSVGEYVNKFEEQFAEYVGAKYAIATSNGTSALHTSLIVAGVTEGDEVITQALSFVATANAISYCGAKPIFLDVDKGTAGLCPLRVREFLEKETVQTKNGVVNKSTNKRIAAIVPMHTFGHPCKLDELVKISNEYNIPLVEDAAESLGSYFKGRHTGTYGKIGAFSFNGNKIITCGGGGVIVTDDENLAKRAKHITTTAKTPHKWEYSHDEVGYNYRMPNLNAAMICAQLEQLPRYLESKRKLAEEYILFGQSNDLQFLKEPVDACSNYWLNTVCVNSREEREEFLKELNESGVMSRPIWTLLHKMPMFKDCQTDSLQNSQWFEDRLINIPSSVLI